MTMPSFLYQYLLWISGLTFVISLFFMVFFIIKLVRLVRRATILRVPILEKQNIEFTEAGRVVLCIEGSLFTTRFRNLGYELSMRNGERISAITPLLPGKTSSFSRARIQIQSYEIPTPGFYVLRIKGLEADQQDDSDHQIVFTRPYIGRMVGYIIGIVLSAELAIAGIVFFCIRFFNQGAGG